MEKAQPDQKTEEKPTAFQDFLTGFQLNSGSMEAFQLLIEKQPELLLGEHYWRTVSKNGADFAFPTTSGSSSNVVAFSRISNEKEILCAINLSVQKEAVVYVTLDDNLHSSGSRMACLFASAASPRELNVEDRNGKAVRLTVPPGGLVVYG
jgi:hypothetical protein